MKDRDSKSSDDDSLADLSENNIVKERTSLQADFHKVRQKKSFHTDLHHLSGFRLKVAIMLDRDYFVNGMAFIILLDFLSTLVDVDSRARGHETPTLTLLTSEICLGLYTLELGAVFYLHGIQRACSHKSILFDLFCVVSGYMATLIYLLGALLPTEAKFLADLKVMRLIRILRVARVIRKTRSLRELQKLLQMMSTGLKALGWSFVFCFAFMTLWAMLMVEFVHPLMQQMFRDGRAFQDCPECADWASSVMKANFLLFKTVIAGDSWGKIAVPVIEHYPATAIIFCGSLLTLVFGVLNMVVAVVVDSFAESRQKDLLHLAEELEHENTQDKKHLEEMFDRLDSKGKGDVTLDQLVEGASIDEGFQSRLRVMDIDQDDLEQFFHMIDSDMSGAINKEEFVGPMSRWIVDSKTAPRFVKYNVERVLHRQGELLKQNQQQFSILSSRLDELCEHLLQPYRGEVPKIRASEATDGTDETLATLGVSSLSSTELGIEQPKESTSDASLLLSFTSGRPPDIPELHPQRSTGAGSFARAKWL